MSRRPKFASAVLKGESKLGSRTAHLDLLGRRLWDNPGGRRRNFDNATVLRMRAALEVFLVDQKAATGRLPYRKVKAVTDFVDKLVADEGVMSSYNILTKQVIRPVFQKLKPRKSDRNAFRSKK
jgi:hypothetical protein